MPEGFQCYLHQLTLSESYINNWGGVISRRRNQPAFSLTGGNIFGRAAEVLPLTVQSPLPLSFAPPDVWVFHPSGYPLCQ